MHRRSLPIAAPCQVFEPTPEQSFCDHCRTHVHDLSAMTKPEAEALLASNVGRRICVAYRTTQDGTVIHRPPARASGPLMALGLAACAAHPPELELPGTVCRDPQGYEVDCERSPRAGDPVIPDDAHLEPTEDAQTGIPIEVLLVPDYTTHVGGDGQWTVGLVIPDVEVAPIPSPRAVRAIGPVSVTELSFEVLDAKASRKLRRAARRRSR